MQRLTAAILLTVLPLSALATPALSHPASPIPDGFSLIVAQGSNASLVSSDPGSPINVRDGASRLAYARHIGYAGDRVEVLDQTPGEDGYMWYYVRFIGSNAVGWVRGDFIVLDGEEYWN